MLVALKADRIKGTQDDITTKFDKNGAWTARVAKDKREKNILNTRIIYQTVKTRRIGMTPKRKGSKAIISRDFFTLIAKYLNMD